MSKDVMQGAPIAQDLEAITSTETTVSAPVKKSRRGISNETRSTNRLKFDHKDASPNGLFLAHLESVEVRLSEAKEDSGRPSFVGLEVPRLVLTFASNDEEVNRRKYIVHSFNAVESNSETIPGGKEEWKVNQVLQYLKHILEVYVLKGKEMEEAMEDALTLSYEDFDEEGQYLPVDAELVVNSWKVLFENFANIVNNSPSGKPYYVQPNGRILPIWLKLIRCVKTKNKGWVNVSQNGELSLPQYVGEGVIEIVKPNVSPIVRVNAISESIAPKVVETPKIPTQLPTNNVGMMGGIHIPDSMNTGVVGTDAIGMMAAEDMPF